ncbi:MAG TPA: hypothetical protein VE197_11560 [Mycobacterium sp.]|nr:hypothetical protein [Mycobacterium sp.]
MLSSDAPVARDTNEDFDDVGGLFDDGVSRPSRYEFVDLFA